MGRTTRILIWTCSATSLLVAAAALYIDRQLEASRLGPRVAGLLAEAGIKGSIDRVEAALGGGFSAEGVDLTLADGTRVRAEAIKGRAAVLRLARGHVHLSDLEAKGVDITLAAPSTETVKAPASSRAAATGDLGLGRFSLGATAASGREQLADGTVLRFNVRSEGLDPSGETELRAGLAWTGSALGSGATDPRADLTVTATFARTLGAHGLGWRELAADVGRLSVRLATRDAGGPSAGRGPQVDIDAAAAKGGLEGRVAVRDAKGVQALDSGFTLGDSLRLDGRVNLSTADLGLLTPADRTRICRVRGSLTAAATPTSWSVSADLAAAWDDLSVFSRSIPPASRCEWKAKLAAQGDASGWSVDSALVEGPGGFTLRVNKPLRWHGGALPIDSSGAPLELAANDAPLSAFAPFLAPTGFVAVAGTWSAGAEIAFADGEATVTCPRAISVAGLQVEREGAPLLSQLNLVLPLRADRGGIAVQGFQGGVGGRTLASGDLSLRPGAKKGDWLSDVRLHVDLGDLAGQPGWESIPFGRLRGVTVDFNASLAADAGGATSVTASSGSIRNGTVELLTLRQRAPIAIGSTLPIGSLFDAKAADLPLESISALVPGLGLAGTLARADLTLGARSDGTWYVRSEAGPIRFADTSASWAGKPYLEHCDLATEVDLAFGAESTLRFEKTELRSRGRTLATGSATVPLGKGWPRATVQGELGALALQPFARALGQVAAGSYQASLTPRGADGLDCELSVRDAGFNDRALRVSLIQLAASVGRDGAATTATGSFRVGAAGNSAGTLSLRTEMRDARRQWAAKVDIAELALDDILGLAPPETDAAPKAADLTPDRQPAWAGHCGTLELTLAKAGFGDLAARDVRLVANIDGDTARLLSLTGSAMGGRLSAEGTLVFDPSRQGGPYVLGSTASVADLDIAQVANLVEVMRGNAEGKVQGKAKASARAPNLGRIASNLEVDVAVDAADGAIRMPRSAAAISGKIGTAADVGIGIAALTSVLGKGKTAETAGRIAGQGRLLREMQKAAEHYRYSKLEIRGQRLADGTLKLSNADIRGESLSLVAHGSLSAQAGTNLLDWPIDVTAQLRGNGALGDCFRELGFDNGEPSADGQRKGPWFQVAGSINHVQTNLIEVLLAAPKPAGDTPPPPVSQPGRKTDIGSRLLERITR